MVKKTKEKKIYNKVVRFLGGKKKGKDTFIEFGWIENPTFHNDIYVWSESAHKGGGSLHELRTDEALLYIQGLSMTLNVPGLPMTLNVKGERGQDLLKKMESD